MWRHPGESLRRRAETSIERAGNGHLERPGSLTTKQRVKSQIPIPLCGLEAFACGPAVKVSPQEPDVDDSRGLRMYSKVAGP